ncbi:MAG: 50S ribosomal protein L35 [Clostridiales bacterium]|jgi:large subunit ribosomal protein L35|nr:50S ribosomal protein L35 [Clostridiales bacterium]
MPKMKTHSGAAKRFGFTAKGKVKRNTANRRHLLNCKPHKRKVALRKRAYADKTNVEQVKKLLPYG